MCCVLCSLSEVYLGTVTGTDPDNDPLTFRIVDRDDGPFRMRTDGSVYVDTSLGWLDYETKRTYSVIVELVETSNIGGGLLGAVGGRNRTLTINVLDLNEAPRFVSIPSLFHVNEHVSNGTSVTQESPSVLRLYDEDDGNNTMLNVSIVGDGSTYFDIVAVSGGGRCRGNVDCELVTAPGAPDVDFDECLRLIPVEILAVDSEGLQVLLNTTVTIDDINQRERQRGVVVLLFVCFDDVVEEWGMFCFVLFCCCTAPSYLPDPVTSMSVYENRWGVTLIVCCESMIML
jgi:hypothetical protein